MSKIYDVGIIGGGISGSVIALQLSELGIKNVFFEQKDSLVNGPPFCHLHAGGNLYPEISDEQCRILMKQSIEMAKLFPASIDNRPTFISIPKTEKYEVETIISRLKMLVDYYKELIDDDASNEILGPPEEYYRVYYRKELEDFSKQQAIAVPKTNDEWMVNVSKFVNYDKLKMPVFLVQEYGWNLFRTAAQAQLALEKSNNCQLMLNTKILDFKDVRNENVGHNWEVYTANEVFNLNYLVNACGFRTGEMDKSLKIEVRRLIEFKAAYISKWENIPGLIPELIFHGERGTPNGMAQLTPCFSDYYQIHGMTKEITLFNDGLVQSNSNNAQPKFNDSINQKLDKGWDKEEVDARTESAIDFVSKFVPTFGSAKVGGPPLFGAQQIPGDDPDLRVGEVSFPYKFYARSEIVKASSSLFVAEQILMNLIKDGVVSVNFNVKKSNSLLDSVSIEEIDNLAAKFAISRGYPEELSRLFVNKK